MKKGNGEVNNDSQIQLEGRLWGLNSGDFIQKLLNGASAEELANSVSWNSLPAREWESLRRKARSTDPEHQYVIWKLIYQKSKDDWLTLRVLFDLLKNPAMEQKAKTGAFATLRRQLDKCWRSLIHGKVTPFLIRSYFHYEGDFHDALGDHWLSNGNYKLALEACLLASDAYWKSGDFEDANRMQQKTHEVREMSARGDGVRPAGDEVKELLSLRKSLEEELLVLHQQVGDAKKQLMEATSGSLEKNRRIKEAAFSLSNMKNIARELVEYRKKLDFDVNRLENSRVELKKEVQELLEQRSALEKRLRQLTKALSETEARAQIDIPELIDRRT